jgi:hypothetical protein
MKIKSFIPHPSAFILWAVIALVWANLPYLLGYTLSTPDHQFGGFFLYEQDGYSYYAKMHQGAQGAWAFHLPYTSENEYQGSGLALMFFIVLGKLAPLGLSYPLLYHGARLLSSLLLLIMLARFIARFVTDRRWQTWTWWLLLFGGGWGLAISYLINPAYVAYELVAPDAFTFSILYGPPHVILGYALLLIWIEYVIHLTSRRYANLREAASRLLIANLIGLLTALSREAYGPAFAGIMLAYLLALLIQQRKIPWRAASITAAACLGAGAYGVYMLIAYRVIPAFAAWYRQNPFASPDLSDFLLGFAPLLILAAIGLYLTFARPQPDRAILSSLNRTFLLAWLIAGPIMAYLPIAISRRLIIGWQIPLSIFGAYALLRLWESRRPLRRALALSALAATALTTLLIIVGGSMFVALRQPSLFQSADQLATLSWLSRHTTDRDVVLSDWRFGNVLPIYADARVLSGHPIETIDFAAKNALIDRFFDPAVREADRQALIDQWAITLAVAIPDRRAPPEWEPVFQAGAYRVYRLAP